MPNDLILWYALRSETNGLTSAHMSLMNIVRTTCEAITNFSDACLITCPNKRVRHLAQHGKKKTRKKNWNRAKKLMRKEFSKYVEN